MDAIQIQQMAKASMRTAKRRAQQVAAALRRVAEHPRQRVHRRARALQQEVPGPVGGCRADAHAIVVEG